MRETHETTVECTPATAGDLAGVVEIQNFTASTSHARFATQPSSVEERRGWFAQFAETGPYQMLVARCDDQVIGYACSQRYRDQEAFRETVEVSIGLREGSKGQGTGTALYRALFGLLADEAVHVALAGIALPNDASVALHRKFGFTEIGTFHEYAVKNGRYVSSLWMERLRPAPFPEPEQPGPVSDRVSDPAIEGCVDSCGSCGGRWAWRGPCSLADDVQRGHGPEGPQGRAVPRPR